MKTVSHSEVTLIDHMGTDLSIVNAARVSFGKRKEEFGGKDSDLIAYLAKHNHWTPFAHTAITVHCHAPLFLARQLGKHQVGLVWNEESRRYVDDDPQFYMPEIWHTRPTENKKQGRGQPAEEELQEPLHDLLSTHCEQSLQTYKTLLSYGIAPEEARMVLPQNMMVQWYWTGSLVAFARVYNLRAESHAQLVAQQFAELLSEKIAPLFPVAWNVLTGQQNP